MSTMSKESIHWPSSIQHCATLQARDRKGTPLERISQMLLKSNCAACGARWEPPASAGGKRSKISLGFSPGAFLARTLFMQFSNFQTKGSNAHEKDFRTYGITHDCPHSSGV